MDSKIEEFVNVSVRIRPVLNQDSTESSCLQVISKQPPVLFVLDRSQTYHFDNIFTEKIDQETVYNETVKPLVDYVKQGYSCTVFAYGQTGTGKTYTMGTSQARNNNAGLIPRALEQFFEYSDYDIETDISVSFIEIYNEKVFDLLKNNKVPIPVKGFQVQGVSQEKVFNCYDAKHFLEIGSKNRHTSETKQNSNSSRSHAIFSIHCNVRNKLVETTAKLNLVDLAGCESVKKTGNQGSTFQEGVNINKGLLCIGQVMSALSTNSSFIPYRQSIITSILQDSLNKRNFVSLIACVNGNPEDCNETVQTLEFAQRVKRMKNKPEVNEAVMQYKKDHPTLFQHLKTSNTPFKRPASFQTPCMSKRIRTAPLKMLNVPLSSTTSDSPKSLSSISVSSVSSNIESVHQTLSPVIRKYMAEMESSVVNRIEFLIKDTLKRPTRSSILKRENENLEKENTPSMSWDKIQNEVSRMVRTELAQLTSKSVRATSSPIVEHDDFNKLRRVLKYESPILNETPDKETDNSQNHLGNTETIFKVPNLPIAKKKSRQSKRVSSPIDFVPRRSTRLSLKRMKSNDSTLDLNVSLEPSFTYKPNKKCLCNGNDSIKSNLNESRYQKRRCSVRLAKKRKALTDSFGDDSHQEKANLNDDNSLNDFDIDATRDLKSIKNFEGCGEPKTNDRRKSVRLQGKTKSKEAVKKLTVGDTAAGKRLMKNRPNGDSPATARTKEVLVLLNNGTVKQLEKLHCVGPKTAQQVALFREIKGPLKKISDLSMMPGWQGKKFKTFIEQNFVKNELM